MTLKPMLWQDKLFGGYVQPQGSNVRVCVSKLKSGNIGRQVWNFDTNFWYSPVYDFLHHGHQILPKRPNLKFQFKPHSFTFPAFRRWWGRSWFGAVCSSIFSASIYRNALLQLQLLLAQDILFLTSAILAPRESRSDSFIHSTISLKIGFKKN